MPDDLLRFVTGPTPLSSAWLWLPVLLSLVLIGWYTAVLVLTSTRDGDGVVARTRDALARRRFLAAVRRTRARLAAGEVDAATAGTEVNRTLRRFLALATGTPVEYMHVAAMTDGVIADTAPIFARLDDVRFNAVSDEDADEIAAAAEAVIVSWT